MAHETSKSNQLRRRHLQIFKNAFRGRILDVGCGDDPITNFFFNWIKEVVPFDKENGDASVIDNYFPPNSFDCVYASQFLEHVDNPLDCYKRMVSLVKPLGFIVISVPDFDLYERRIFPSIWNGDHKTTWGLLKPHHAKGYGLIDVMLSPGNTRLLYASVCDTNYDYTAGITLDQTQHGAEAWVEGVAQKIC